MEAINKNQYIKLTELEKVLEDISPLALEEPWDNSGLQHILSLLEPCNNNTYDFFMDFPINKILVALEITKEVILEAEKLEVNAIVTHHPMFFYEESEEGQGLIPVANSLAMEYSKALIDLKIPVYSCHTNFDRVEGGNNYYLANLIGLKNLRPIVDDMGFPLIGLIGQCDNFEGGSISLGYLSSLLKKVLNIPRGGLRLVGNPDHKVEVVGLCTGSGSDLVELAFEQCKREGLLRGEAGFVFITGDLKYHRAVELFEKGLATIDGGHFGTEWIFVPNMARQLYERLGTKVKIIESKVDRDPFLWI